MMGFNRYRDWTAALVGDPERLATLRSLGLLDTPPEESFDRLTRMAARLLDVPIALVSLVDEDRQFFKSQSGLQEPWATSRETPLDRSVCQYTLGSAEPLVIEDVRLDPLSSNTLAVRDLGVIAYLGMPLMTEDGVSLGSLCAIDHKPRKWTTREIGELHDLATIAAHEISFREFRRSQTSFSSLVASGPGDPEGNPSAVRQAGGIESILLHSRDIVAVLNADRSIRYISPSVAPLLQCQPGALQGQLIDMLMDVGDIDILFGRTPRESPDDVGHVRPPPVVRLSYGSGPGRKFELVLTDLLSDPFIHGHVVNFRDVDGRLDLSAQHSDSAAYYRALVQQTSDITTIVDIDGTIRYDSSTKTRMLGYGAEELIGRNSLEFIHPDDVADMLAAFQESLASGLSKSVLTYRFRHADGSWRWLESIADNLLADPDIEGLVLSTRDITEQKHTEEALRQAYLTSLVRHATDVVTVLDSNHTVRYASPAIETMLGYAPTMCIGIPAVDIFHPSDRNIVNAALHRLLSEAHRVVRFQARAKHQDEGWRWLEVAATNLIEEPGIHGIVVNARDITDRIELERQLAHEATHDALTGLANRTLFLDRLRSVQSRRDFDVDPIAVLFIDLDDFKLINDSHGHIAGDLGLQIVGQRIRKRLGRIDMIARFGGDEFAVLAHRVKGIEEAGRVAAALLEAIGQPFVLAGQETRIRASIGIAVSSAILRDPLDLLRAADTALYRAKAVGGGTWLPYTPDVAEEARQRLTIELQLRHALERRELRVRYQPIVDLTTGMMIGAEALVRWKHPEKGLIGPTAFLDIAQASGLIEPIGQWVLNEACAQAARWTSFSPVWVSVNIASEQLRQPHFVSQISEAIDRTGIDPAMLHLEITESITARDGMAYLDQLHELRRMGVGLAIDDFGTGESSLASLRRYPVDTVKIDRAFIAGADADEEAAAIVRAVLGVGRALGLAVIAEGVETEGERRLLHSLGCASAQGFYFGRPMMSHRIMERLQRQIAAAPASVIRSVSAD